MLLNLHPGHRGAAPEVQVIDVLLEHGAILYIELKEQDGDGDADQIQQEYTRNLYCFLACVLHQHFPVQLVECLLVDELEQDQRDEAEREPEKDLVEAVHAQVHPRDGHHGSQDEEWKAEPVLGAVA